jgi:hypothetical protein
MQGANARFGHALDSGEVDVALQADDDLTQEGVTPLIRRAEGQRSSSLAGRDSVAQFRAIIERCRARDTDAAALARSNWLSSEPQRTIGAQW